MDYGRTQKESECGRMVDHKEAQKNLGGTEQNHLNYKYKMLLSVVENGRHVVV